MPTTAQHIPSTDRERKKPAQAKNEATAAEQLTFRKLYVAHLSVENAAMESPTLLSRYNFHLFTIAKKTKGNTQPQNHHQTILIIRASIWVPVAPTNDDIPYQPAS